MPTTLSLLQGDKFPVEFYGEYSKFKHGSKSQAREFGRHAASAVVWQPNKTFIFYSAPHNNIPTASNAFKDYFLSFCAGKFINGNNTVKQSKVNRLYSYDDDYGLMNKEQREKAISSDIFNIDKSIIEPEDVLVFVDDIKITGSHEKRMMEVIEREGITNEVIFVYLAVYTGDDPTIENRLNHHTVNNLKDVNDIIRNEEFIFNTRVVKYILKADIEHFVSFITYQSISFKETLYSLSILNEYYKNSKYKANFNILKHLL